MGVVTNKLWPAFCCITICFADWFSFGHSFIFFALPLVMFFGALASALCNGIAITVIVHDVFMLLYFVTIIIMLQFTQVMLPILNNLFGYQRIHRCIGFYISRINSLPAATKHAFADTKREHFCKQFFEHFFTIQLSCS